MPDSNRRTLAVIGAGPKGIAVAVKAKVLEEFGLAVDRVVLIERHSVAAHWSGEAGYTNGELKLGTSPEKDVVFPIETDTGDPSLNRKIRQRLMDFTWTSFLVQTGRYSDWVDRGRPAPCHQRWAGYLKWVSEQLAPEVTLINAEVAGIELHAQTSSWKLSLRNGEKLVSDRLMVTGPGKTRLDFVHGEIPEGVYHLESFWSALQNGVFARSGKIAIVGAGENAASVLLTLSKYAPDLQVDVISPKGFVSTRSENFYENQIYSQPEKNGWTDLSLTDRLDFVARTDLGVFSVHAMQILNDETRHNIVPGRVVSLRSHKPGLTLNVEYNGRTTSLDYEQAVLATGFDHVSTLEALFTPATLTAIQAQIGAPLSHWELTRRMQEDLSIQGLEPSLHLPMLAGVMQGPGFANLSCLGSLSDRVVLEPMFARIKNEMTLTGGVAL